MCQAFKAGADVVVIGNHFEQNPQDLPLFIEMRQRYAQSR
jgi:heptaprenylglyceryl phosphate synthase